MGKELFFIFMGYLSGSILFAHLSEKLLNREPFLQDSKDGNPGAANAFQHGGFGCGMFTLLGDMLKGFLPIYMYVKSGGDFIASPFLASTVLAAPVLGHAFPIFFGFQGGKGIAVTFGCLLGIWPTMEPVLLLAVMFLFFTLILCITPHFQRTMVTYIATFFLMMGLHCEPGIIGGFMIVTVTVCVRLHMSKEERKKMRVKLLWTH